MSIKRLVYLPLLVAGLLLAGAGPVAAHESLVSAEPADGASVATGPPQVRLTFDQPLQSEFAAVTVTGPGGTKWEAGAAVASGNSVTVAVRPLGPAGDYVVGYRVLSADGHPVAGTLRFRLTTAGNGTPAEPEPAASGTAGDGGTPLWPWVVAAVLLLGAGVLAVVRLNRPDRRDEHRHSEHRDGEHRDGQPGELTARSRRDD